jgi:hypothetical protein
MTYRLTSTAHFLTFDVNDCTHVLALLDTLREANARATFFVSARSARKEPAVIRSVTRAGHEVAVRGSVASADWNSFRDDAGESKAILENVCGTHVRGYRALPQRLGHQSAWAFQILAEEGFEYDSSCTPFRKRGDRLAAVPDYPYAISCGAGTLLELPITRVGWFGRSLAARTRTGLPGVVAFASDGSEKRAARDRIARLIRQYRFDAIGNRLQELSFGAPTTFAA